MGWASGSELLSEIIKVVDAHIPKKEKKDIYKAIISSFEMMDCDTIHEAFDDSWPELEEAYYELNPDLIEDEDE